jgi:hypothetical protein
VKRDHYTPNRKTARARARVLAGAGHGPAAVSDFARMEHYRRRHNARTMDATARSVLRILADIARGEE